MLSAHLLWAAKRLVLNISIFRPLRSAEKADLLQILSDSEKPSFQNTVKPRGLWKLGQFATAVASTKEAQLSQEANESD
jgi:hypothetical protein